MNESELPLEVQLRLARWKLEIEKLNLADLRLLYMELATESAQKELQYQDFLSAVIASDQECHIKLKSLEKEHKRCQRRIFNSMRDDNLP